jgi:hypothetical protein
MRTVIQVACCCVWLVYTIVGIFGVAAVAGSAIPAKIVMAPNILAHFTSGGVTDALQVGFALSIITSFPLQVVPLRDTIWSLYGPDIGTPRRDDMEAAIGEHKRPQMPQASLVKLTAGVLSGALCVALAVSRMDAVYMISGATGNCTVAFFLPTIFFLVWEERYPRSVQTYADGASLRTIAKLVFVVGLFTSISGICGGIQIILSDDTGPIEISIVDPVRIAQVVATHTNCVHPCSPGFCALFNDRSD